MSWFSEGEKTNPSDGTLLADTEAITDGGSIAIKILVTATTLDSVLIQHRNAANDTTLAQFRMKVPVNDTRSFDMGPLTLAGDERVRVMQDGTVVGKVSALIVTG